MHGPYAYGGENFFQMANLFYSTILYTNFAQLSYQRILVEESVIVTTGYPFSLH
jgi:hypothetical protein